MRKSLNDDGFIILPVLTVIAGALTAALVAAAVAGGRASASARAAEARVQVRILADACASLVSARIAISPTYAGDETARFPSGECLIGAPQQDASDTNRHFIDMHASASGFSATTRLAYGTAPMCLPAFSTSRDPP